MVTGDAGIGTGMSGLHHTSSLRNLMVTREKTMHIPRNMAVLPHSKAHMVLVAYADNCLRYVDVTVPMESRDNNKAGLVRVLTVVYNKDLSPVSNQGKVPRTTNASKM